MDKEEAGIRAGEIARGQTLDAMEVSGETPERFVKRLRSLLNAGHVKAKWTGEKWVYSKRMADNSTRFRAVHLEAQILDLLPDERLRLNVEGDLVDALKELNERHRQRMADGASGE